MSSPATLTATSLPGQLLEIAGYLQAAELSDLAPTGLPNNDNVQISFDTEGNTVTITATIPVVPSITPDGLKYVADDYLP